MEETLLEETAVLTLLLFLVSVSQLQSYVIINDNLVIGILVYFLCIRKKNNVPPVNYSANNGNPNTTVRQTFELTRDEPAM